MSKTQQLAMSYSRLETVRSCPKQLWYKAIKKVPEPEASQTSRGLTVHSALESFVRTGSSKGPMLATEFRRCLPELRRIRKTDGRPELSIAFDAAWKRVDWFDPRVAMRVKIDVLHRTRPKVHRVVDYKTGKPKPERHGESLRLYALAVLLTEPNVETLETGVWYVDYEARPQVLGVYQGDLAAAVRREKAYWEGEVRDALKAAKGWKATPGRACDWCPYSCKRYDAQNRPGPCADAA